MKVGALCLKKEGAHFDTPSLSGDYLPVNLPDNSSFILFQLLETKCS